MKGTTYRLFFGVILVVFAGIILLVGCVAQEVRSTQRTKPPLPQIAVITQAATAVLPSPSATPATPLPPTNTPGVFVLDPATPLPTRTPSPAPTDAPPIPFASEPLPATTLPDAPTIVPTRASTIIAQLRLTATPDPYDPDYMGRTIEMLTLRSYGGGEVEALRKLEENDLFTRYEIKYPSDGLDIYGFINVPNEGTRFPVAVVLHGYIDVEQYKTEAYTTVYADRLAEAGYFVFHPNYRNHPPSDFDPGYNTFRVDYAIDVLNLLAIIESQSQDPTGLLRRADASQVHMLGHSMGGGIAQRVVTVRPEAVDALLLYGSMSGNEWQNYYERIRNWGSREWRKEVNAPPGLLERVSPIYYLDRWRTAVSIHHGSADNIVPPAWSDHLCQHLQALDKPVECFNYPNAPHTFYGSTAELFIERMIDFFDQY